MLLLRLRQILQRCFHQLTTSNQKYSTKTTSILTSQKDRERHQAFHDTFNIRKGQRALYSNQDDLLYSTKQKRVYPKETVGLNMPCNLERHQINEHCWFRRLIHFLIKQFITISLETSCLPFRISCKKGVLVVQHMSLISLVSCLALWTQMI